MSDEEPKQKFCEVTNQDVGTKMGNPIWVNWATQRIEYLEGALDDAGEMIAGEDM